MAFPSTQRIDNFINRGKTAYELGGTSAQIRAHLRQPHADRITGRRATELSNNSKPWIFWDFDETLTYRNAAKDAAIDEIYAPNGVKLPKGVKPTPRAWLPWAKTLRQDVIEPEMAALYKSQMESGLYNIGILTSRSERSRGATRRILKKNNMSPDLLIMRPHDKKMDEMGTGEYKVNRINKYVKDLNKHAQIDNFYEDTESVVKSLREAGINTTQVVPKILEGGGGRELAEQVSKGRGLRTIFSKTAAWTAARAVVGRV